MTSNSPLVTCIPSSVTSASLSSSIRLILFRFLDPVKTKGVLHSQKLRSREEKVLHAGKLTTLADRILVRIPCLLSGAEAEDTLLLAS